LCNGDILDWTMEHQLVQRKNLKHVENVLHVLVLTGLILTSYLSTQKQENHTSTHILKAPNRYIASTLNQSTPWGRGKCRS
jgi:hypothetical protein